MTDDPQTEEALERLGYVIKLVKAGCEQRWGMDDDKGDNSNEDISIPQSEAE